MNEHQIAQNNKKIDSLEKAFFIKPETSSTKPCRACTEFKNWTKRMTGTPVCLYFFMSNMFT